ncbi:MAG: two-component regulator propeller domain-containing protein [Muribaculaceae bacterium]
MKHPIRHIIVLIAFLLVALCSNAGDYYFRHLNNRFSELHHQVEAIDQDQQGRIWIGMRNGLACFDGYEMRTYRHESATNSLPRGSVFNMHIDHQNRLWLCSSGTFLRYRNSFDDFKNYNIEIWTMTENSKGDLFFGGDYLFRYNEEADSLEKFITPFASCIMSLATDSHDNMYILTNDALYRFNASNYKMENLAALGIKWTPTYDLGIMSVFIDSSDRLWISANDSGVACCDCATRKVIHHFPKSQISGAVRAISENQEGQVWIGTENGIYIINPDFSFSHIKHNPNNINSIGDNAIYDIFCDNDGNMWIGSYFGGIDLMLSDNLLFSHYEPSTAPGLLNARVPREMVETEPGKCWIATEDNGLFILENGHFTQFTEIPGVEGNVHALFYDKARSELWIGTRFNGLFCYNTSTHVHRQYFLADGSRIVGVFSIVKQRNGTVSVATIDGVLQMKPDSDSFSPIDHEVLHRSFIYKLCLDHSDNIWVGTTRTGLYRIAAKDGKVDHFNIDGNSADSDNFIVSVIEDSKGTLWFSTDSGSLINLQFYNGKVQTGVIDFDGLISQGLVYSIFEDKQSRLWITTDQGLFQYNLNSKALTLYSKVNGLPSTSFNYNSVLELSSGEILIGTIEGLISFNPNSLQVAKPRKYDIHLNSLSINGKAITVNEPGSPLTQAIDFTDKIILSYDQARQFYIDYGAVTPLNIAVVEYLVKMDGIDKNWRNVGNQRRFYAYNLQPGSYCLHIRAKVGNVSDEYCPERLITIVVKPPFYLSPWAWAIYALLACGIAAIFFLVLRNRIRERNKLRLATLEMEKIEELNREKSSFYTNVSHELKTPLSLIRAPLKCISVNEHDEETRKNISMAIKNTMKMEKLINDLVTFSKVENHTFPFFVQQGNPMEFIEQMTLGFVQVAHEKGITLSVYCEDNGENVWFSPSYVEHILDNLLSNALKFTPTEGRVLVKGSILAHSIGENTAATFLSISVTDTGIGIAPEEQQNVFNHFYQTKRGYSTNSSGWGIGLSLVKQLAAMHKGNVSLVSEQGKGSTFTVELRVDRNAFTDTEIITDDKVVTPLSTYKFSNTALLMSSDSEEPVAISTPNLHTLLIVDDNNDLLEFLSSFFGKRYNILLAHDGEEALSIARNENVEIIITDVMMPKIDGVQLCRAIKEDNATSHIPVILLTAKSESQNVVEGYQSGADAYVTKPFDPQILELQIKNILMLIKTRQSTIIESGTAAIPDEQLSIFDKNLLANIEALVVENIPNSDFSVTDITEALHISRSMLHYKMKTFTNMSMGDYIRRKRIDEACRLLKSGYNVSETADMTGFSDYSTFSKAFKKLIGVAPSFYTSDSGEHTDHARGTTE